MKGFSPYLKMLLNRKQLKTLWNQLKSPEDGAATWQALSPQDIDNLRKSVKAQENSWAYWVLETKFHQIVLTLVVLSTIGIATYGTHSLPPGGTVDLKLGVLLFFVSFLPAYAAIGIPLELLSVVWVGHIPWLKRMLEPLSQDESGCKTALSLVSESSRCKAHQHKVIQDGREFLEGDLDAVRQLARLDRADAKERERLVACRALHLLDSVEASPA